MGFRGIIVGIFSVTAFPGVVVRVPALLYRYLGSEDESLFLEICIKASIFGCIASMSLVDSSVSAKSYTSSTPNTSAEKY